MLWDTTLISFIWLTVCVVLIIGLAYWFTRYTAGRGTFGAFQAGQRMEVLDHLPLGRDQRVILARVGDRHLLLGVTQAEIRLLAELTAEEAASWKPGEADGERPDFKEALISVIKQKRRR